MKHADLLRSAPSPVQETEQDWQVLAVYKAGKDLTPHVSKWGLLVKALHTRGQGENRAGFDVYLQDQTVGRQCGVRKQSVD